MNELRAPSILLATQNRGKLREFQELLSRLPGAFCNLRDYPGLIEVEEVGSSFKENAILKAKGYASQTGLVTLADDSGLEVKALGGAPGIYSARYSGENASDTDRINKLLRELSSSENEDRSARFVCVIAIFNPNTNEMATFDGTCEGQIATEPQGNNGFGYDPIFVPEGFTESFGSLSTSIKQQISHRSRALARAYVYLHDFIASRA